MRHVTRPLVTRLRRVGDIPWGVTWPHAVEGKAPHYRRFDTWAEAYQFATEMA